MSFTPLQYINLYAPQWASDPRLISSPSLIDVATQRTNAQVFGDNTNLAIALRVLHIMALQAQRGGEGSNGTSGGVGLAGQVSSVSEGGLSISLQSSKDAWSTKFGDLATTQYGEELLGLIKGSGILGVGTKMAIGNSKIMLSDQNYIPSTDGNGFVVFTGL